ncbi:unnamed protein product, partial [Polarella glacialis]
MADSGCDQDHENCEWMDELYRDDEPLEGDQSWDLSLEAAKSSVRVVSLGCFCGVKFSIQRLGLDTQHLPFDWVRSRIGSLVHFLRTDFEGFFDTLSAPVDVPGTGGKMAFRSPGHSFWHDDVRELEVREKLGRRIARLKALGCLESDAEACAAGASASSKEPAASTLLFVRALATTG